MTKQISTKVLAAKNNNNDNNDRLTSNKLGFDSIAISLVVLPSTVNSKHILCPPCVCDILPGQIHFHREYKALHILCIDKENR